MLEMCKKHFQVWWYKGRKSPKVLIIYICVCDLVELNYHRYDNYPIVHVLFWLYFVKQFIYMYQ